MSRALVNKQALRSYCAAYRHPSSEGFTTAVRTFFAEDAQIYVVHPFNDMTGTDAYLERVLAPLHTAFENLFRTDYIAFGGTYEGSDWVTCTGYYTGHFARPWLGIRPTGALAYLRFGEFHRMESGRVVESYIS